MTFSSRNIPTSTLDSDFGTIIVLGIFTLIIGFFLCILVLVPGFVIASKIYAGIVSVPSTFTALEWGNFAWNLLWGMIAGLLVAALRLRRRSKILEGLTGILASPAMISSARVNVLCILLHVLIGAISGSVVGLLGLFSPLQLFTGSTGVLTNTSIPAVSLLTSAGMFNAGGAPSGGWDLIFLLIMIVFLIFILTILISAITTSMLAIVANVLVSGATRGAGGALGSLFLVTTVGLLTTEAQRPLISSGAEGETLTISQFKKNWFRASLVTGIVCGMLVGIVNAITVAASLYIVRWNLAEALGPFPTLEEFNIPIEGGGSCAAFSPDGRFLVIAGSCWDLSTGTKLWYSVNASEVAFNPDGRSLVVIDRDGQRYFVDMASGNYRKSGKGAYGSGIALMAEGHILAYQDEGGGIKLWDLQNRREVRTLKSHIPGYLMRFVWASRANVLAAATENQVVIFDTATGETLHTLSSRWFEYLSINGIALSPDGKLLATGDDSSIHLWDVISGKRVRTLSGHKEKITTITFSPDGRLIASGAYDHCVRLWDAKTGRGLKSVTAHQLSIDSIAFSPDARVLASVSTESVKLWRIH